MTKANGVKVMTALLTALPEKQEEFSQVLRGLRIEISAQPGCLDCVFGRDISGESKYLLLSIWRDGKALDDHLASEPFRILCIGLPLVFGIWILHAITMSVNRERLLAQTAVVGLAVNVGLNLYVIPRMGADGAALATVVGELVSMTMLIAGVGGEVRAARA